LSACRLWAAWTAGIVPTRETEEAGPVHRSPGAEARDEPKSKGRPSTPLRRSAPPLRSGRTGLGRPVRATALELEYPTYEAWRGRTEPAGSGVSGRSYPHRDQGRKVWGRTRIPLCGEACRGHGLAGSPPAGRMPALLGRGNPRPCRRRRSHPGRPSALPGGPADATMADMFNTLYRWAACSE
jgi:hypothetical protein